MSGLHSICYVSSAIRLPSTGELAALLADARDFNRSAEVTGVLLHHSGGFFQYFEGPPAGTAAVYERVKHSHAHHSIIELLNAPTDKRVFGDWLMGSSHVPDSTAMSLRRAEWRRLASDLTSSDGPRPAGLTLLQSYWSTLPESRFR